MQTLISEFGFTCKKKCARRECIEICKTLTMNEEN